MVKTPESGVEDQQSQCTCDSGSGNRTQATLVKAECSCHCANLAWSDSRQRFQVTKSCVTFLQISISNRSMWIWVFQSKSIQ